MKDKRGQLALHRAAAVGSAPMMKLLLEAKSPLNATDIDGMTALHHGKCYYSSIMECHLLESQGLTTLQQYLKAMAMPLYYSYKQAQRRTRRTKKGDWHLILHLMLRYVFAAGPSSFIKMNTNRNQTRKFILQSAEREGIDLE